MILLKKKSVLRKILTLFLLFCLSTVEAQNYTKNPEIVKNGTFIFGAGQMEYIAFDNKTTHMYNTYVNVLPFTLQLGLAKRVEFVGVFPWITTTSADPKRKSDTASTLGDIMVDLKFNINHYWYNFFTGDEISATLDLYMGVNTATGPAPKEGVGNRSPFYPFATGLVDWRWGLLYSQRIFRRLSNYINFIYVYASYPGEDYLPFGSDWWSKKNRSYIFNIHKVIGKFIYPGKIDGEYAGRDDYIIYNVSFNYDIYMKELFYRYKIFMELNGLYKFTPACIFRNEVLWTLGMDARVHKNWRISGSATLPIFLEKNYYFNKRFVIMVYALL